MKKYVIYNNEVFCDELEKYVTEDMTIIEKIDNMKIQITLMLCIS